MNSDIVLDPIVLNLVERFAAKQESNLSSVSLIERILSECSGFRRASVSFQFEGLYRGHSFIIGLEHKMPSLAEMVYGNGSDPIMVFCIADRPGGHYTDGLRWTEQDQTYLRDVLYALYDAAKMRFEEGETKRLLNASHNRV